MLNPKHEITMNESENIVDQSAPTVKSIPLSQGLFALVDSVDYENLNQWRWYAKKGRKTFYAWRNSKTLNGKRSTIQMHCVIVDSGGEKEVDHRDGNGLNNTRGNLRASTVSENTRNRTKRVDSASNYKGVHWHKRDQKWWSQIMVNGKSKWLGYFENPIEAAHAYDAAALKLHGEYARTNQMLGTL